MSITPALIALDWGTSNLRASLLSTEGHVLADKTSPKGIKNLKRSEFAHVFEDVCGEWFMPSVKAVIACGMVGSVGGWKEAPYLPSPATLPDAANSLVEVSVATNLSMHIVPGVMCHYGNGTGNVMRGEETQIWGAGVSDATTFVLPGTHSKWARVAPEGIIQSFFTFMTGEFYELLSRHSTLSGFCSQSWSDGEAYKEGVRKGLMFGKDLTGLVFLIRSGILLKTVDPRSAGDLLAGMLIGAEIGSARDGFLDDGNKPVCHIIGSSILIERYKVAFEIADIAVIGVSENAATKGLYAIAKHACLV